MDNFEDREPKESPIHIRVHSRNSRKSISSICGLSEDLDFKKICKCLKKNFKCNGAVTEDKESGKVIILQGDHRGEIKQFLSDNRVVSGDIIVHGF